MFWFRRGRPAFKPAFLMGVACSVLVLLLVTLGRPARAEGDGQPPTHPQTSPQTASSPATAAAPPAFHLEVHAPEPLRDTLLHHLELQQYRGLQDLDRDELDRLLVSAQDNARNLLATQGYFAAEVKISVNEPEPAASPTSSGQPASDAPAAQHTPWEVLIDVTPGKPVRVSAFQLQLSGDVAHNPELEAVQRSLTETWACAPAASSPRPVGTAPRPKPCAASPPPATPPATWSTARHASIPTRSRPSSASPSTRAPTSALARCWSKATSTTAPNWCAAWPRSPPAAPTPRPTCSRPSSAWPTAATSTRCSCRSTPAATRRPRRCACRCAKPSCTNWCWAWAPAPTVAAACRSNSPSANCPGWTGRPCPSCRWTVTPRP